MKKYNCNCGKDQLYLPTLDNNNRNVQSYTCITNAYSNSFLAQCQIRKKYSSFLSNLALAYECISASILCSLNHELVFSVLKLIDAVSPLSIASAIGSTYDSSAKGTDLMIKLLSLNSSLKDECYDNEKIITIRKEAVSGQSAGWL